MDIRIARGIVRFIAVLHYVIAGLAAAVALLMGSVAFSGMDTGNLLGGLISFFGMVLAAIFTLYAILYGCIGYGLWKCRNWGRVLLLIVSGISVILGVLSAFTLLGILKSFIFRDLAALTGLMILGGISAVLIWLFQFQPDVIGFFKQQTTQ